MKYILYKHPFGYYEGRNKKYPELHDFTSKEFAKRFDDKESAQKVVDLLVQADINNLYDFEIEGIED